MCVKINERVILRDTQNFRLGLCGPLWALAVTLEIAKEPAIMRINWLVLGNEATQF